MDGYVYIIKLSVKMGHSQFYVGWAKNVEARFGHHCRGTGARFLAVAVERGIKLEIIWQAPGTKADERKIKNWKNTRRFLQSQGIAKEILQ